MSLIDGCPEEIEGRTVTGHWERDLIIGKGHRSALCVIVEQKSRYVQTGLLEKYDAATVRKTIESVSEVLGANCAKR
jgi:IS30 family transposase